jgi:gamma-glutamyltranspeptidase/glutathione hydrolase
MPDQPGGRSTSHFSIVDAEGNAVSVTSSVEQAFGSRLMVRGFMLNNQLTDFSFRPEVDGRKVANRVQPGKRPRSSMSPTIALGPDGRFRLAVGSPGGSRIIGYTVQRVLAVLDWGLNVQQAVELPNVVNRNGPTALEAETAAARLAGPLRARGHAVEIEAMTSGLHAVARRPDGTLAGGADPRREGVALGE